MQTAKSEEDVNDDDDDKFTGISRRPTAWNESGRVAGDGWTDADRSLLLFRPHPPPLLLLVEGRASGRLSEAGCSGLRQRGGVAFNGSAPSSIVILGELPSPLSGPFGRWEYRQRW